jgi:beta-phosphoglucomutase-like phosphatase (HAD superfamily)
MKHNGIKAVIFGDERLIVVNAEEDGFMELGMADGMPNYPKILLEQLRDGRYLVALVSEQTRNGVDAVLWNSGLDPKLFDVIISHEDIGRSGPPSPYSYKLALDRLNDVRRQNGFERKWRVPKKYERHEANRAVVLVCSTREACAAILAGMKVVAVLDRTDSHDIPDSFNRSSVDNTVSSLADLVGKKVYQWLRHC